jgi:hypothetical protein
MNWKSSTYFFGRNRIVKQMQEGYPHQQIKDVVLSAGADHRGAIER